MAEPTTKTKLTKSDVAVAIERIKQGVEMAWELWDKELDGGTHVYVTTKLKDSLNEINELQSKLRGSG